MSIEVQLGRIADHQPLQLPRMHVHRRQPHHLALDLFPVGKGINEQALVLVDRDHQFPTATFLQPFSIPGGHHHPAFRIES